LTARRAPGRRPKAVCVGTLTHALPAAARRCSTLTLTPKVQHLMPSLFEKLVAMQTQGDGGEGGGSQGGGGELMAVLVERVLRQVREPLQSECRGR
jgi:hypothetical protein